MDLRVGKQHGQTQTQPHPLPDDIAMILAGEQAELLCFGNSRFHLQDVLDATSLAAAYRGVPGDDGYPKWTPRADAELKSQRSRARALLEEPAVAEFHGALAESLRRRKGMTREEVEAMSSTFPDLMLAVEVYRQQNAKRRLRFVGEPLVRLLDARGRQAP
ncbi:MAG: hypothetical protein ACRDF0_08375 [Candidatus Limnocylindria bacterium]